LIVSSIEEISVEDRENFNLKNGVIVQEVFSGPAKEAGIQPGDVITSISQRKIKDLKDYTKIVKSLKKGSSVQ